MSDIETGRRSEGKKKKKGKKSKDDKGAIKDIALPDNFKEYGVPTDVGNRLVTFSDVDRSVWDGITEVPYLPTPWNFILCILNCVIPGLGTLISSIWADPCSKTQAVIGLLQFCLAYVFIGWIWSIAWAFLLIKKSFSEEKQITSMKTLLIEAGKKRSDDPDDNHDRGKKSKSKSKSKK
ncbi:unnamed protein product [Moneuplotes crassus]|uniref:Uncharacterized protein n=1 Tax=Euplotes crassus TaxID=5936 RepID=A0AAD1XX04_EUPCR|nr:unnamed protein product [Moneuplotes crassus]